MSSEWKKHFYESFEETPIWAAIMTYLAYGVLVIVGHMRDLMRKYGFEEIHSTKEENISGFVPLYHDFESFYTRNLYRRIRDCWNRPICSVPGAEIELPERESPDFGWNFRFTGSTTKALNFGSYNYLGFAENSGPCADCAEQATKEFGCSPLSSRQELGNLEMHLEMENLVAEFVGQEAAITFGMGFATNSMNMPLLVSKGCLIISDAMNHSSLVLGARLSAATIRVFQHNGIFALNIGFGCTAKGP